MALINVLWRHCWRYCWRHCFPQNHVSGDGSNYSIVLVYQLLYPYLLTSNSKLWYYLSVLLLLLFFLSFFVVFHKLFIIQPIGFCSSLTCSKPLIQEQLNRSLQSTEFNPTVKASAFSKIGESFTLQEWEWKISTFSEISEFLQLPKEDSLIWSFKEVLWAHFMGFMAEASRNLNYAALWQVLKGLWKQEKQALSFTKHYHSRSVTF